jgi:alginate O-acetyltransferase complex protein AlgI
MHFASIEYIGLLLLTYVLLRLSKPKFHIAILLSASLVFFSFDSLTNLFYLFYVVFLSFYFITQNKKVGAEEKSSLRIVLQILSIIIPLLLYKFLVPHLPVSINQNQSRLQYLGAVPLGLSFFTLQAVSILIDVKNGAFVKDFRLRDHALYLSFYPQLIAGPIERASNLMRQIVEYRYFRPENLVLAAKFIVWGIFKKMVIADNLAPYVDHIYGEYQIVGGATLLFGTFLFFIQLYADFSGYCDIAKGSAGIIGFNISNNFDYPLSATNIKIFWRKWHTSLYRWLLDYIYIPMVTSFGKKSGKVFSVLLVFMVSSVWHASTLNFIMWGLLNATYYLMYSTFRTLFPKTSTRGYHFLIRGVKTFLTLGAITLTWVFFRAPDLATAGTIYIKIGQSLSNIEYFLNIPSYISQVISSSISNLRVLSLSAIVGIFLILEVTGEMKKYFSKDQKLYYSEVLLWDCVLLSLIVFSMPQSDTFIYFKF